ncbi:MAG: HAMP domain-containing protein [Actinomycetia bacterium]|nr:HAMP domain-containing protein [Actinomycetes bacterium]
MTRRLALRTRLTLLVTIVFGVAMVITSVVVVHVVEDDLVADTRASAESVLSSYLESVLGGTATLGVVDEADTTSFFYRDSEGSEISEQQYFEAIATGLDAEMASILGGVAKTVPSGVAVSEVIPGFLEDTAVSFRINPETGELLDGAGDVVSFTIGPRPVGEPQRIDLGDDAVGVAQTLAFTDGTTFEVGVSSPLRPITGSLAAIRRILWGAVPVLTVAIAAITWLATSRALAPVHTTTGHVQAITADNISERVRVPVAKDEIGLLATTMNDMLARLETSQERMRQFVSDASHELRSPVAASRVQLEVAAANPEDTDWTATAATVIAEQQHLSDLIDDLLTLSKIDETRAPSSQDVDLDDLIITEASRPRSTPVRVSIDKPVRVVGDPALLVRAIRNLVDNACRHAGSDVLITLCTSEGGAVIDVEDDGVGVPVDQRERIFDRFTRIDSARDRGAVGAGLGLAIAHQVARAHEGDLTVSASSLGGARFTLSIPEKES